MRAVGSDSVSAVNESDIDAVDDQISTPSSLPVIRQMGASSAINDVTAYVDDADAEMTAVTCGDIVVDISRDAMQVPGNTTSSTSLSPVEMLHDSALYKCMIDIDTLTSQIEQ